MKQPRHANPNLLEINAFSFMARMRGKYGDHLTIGTIPRREWEEISSSGFALVWLMGVWERSTGSKTCALKDEGLKQAYYSALPGWTDADVKGSPYAIHSYCVDPYLGSVSDLAQARTTINELGMGLILDFVPNHTALDHPWTEYCPEVFIQGSPEDLLQDPSLFFKTGSGSILAHGRDPNFPAWSDTVQLDYFSERARTELIKELDNVAKQCDGLRCDMAMLVLNDVFKKTWGKYLGGKTRPEKEFWTEVISRVKADHPAFLFMAEAYWDLEYRLQQLGFDYTYDKRLYDLMLNSSAREVKSHLLGDANYQRKCVRFIENHDEPRAASLFGKDRSCAAAAVMATVPGLHLFHDGQLEGAAIRMPVQLVVKEKEQADLTIRRFYDRLLAFTARDPLGTGTWTPLDVRPAWDNNWNCGNLLAWIWHRNDAMKLVCVNLSDKVSQGRLHIPGELVQAGPLAFRDVLTDEIYVRTTDEIIRGGLFVELGPWKSHLLDLLS